METTLALLIIALILGIGDYISVKTKAIFSMMFVSGLLFLVGFWFIIPKTLFEDAHIMSFAMATVPMLLVYMGTLMKLEDLKNEWKTLVIALSSIVAVALILFFAASPIIGKQYSVAATGPVSGGVVSTLIMQEAANNKGLETAAVFATLLLVLQTFIGLPIASICVSSEAKKLAAGFRNGNRVKQDNKKSDPESEKKWFRLPPLSKKYQTPFILLLKTIIVAWLAIYTADLLNGIINKYVLALIFGIIFYELGFLENRILDKANSAGIIIFALMIPVFESLPKATPDIIITLILPIIIVFLFSVIAIAVISFLLGKILGYSWQLSLAIGVTCLIGFPGTFIISEEVADAVSENEEERDYISSIILPKMLVGGFATVTIGSVFVASFMVNYL
ncbi:MAG: hypothetical protein JEY94_09345 [Melioribacteraceae bacterium]|nr:hypothetical protein [Melioribacteraceae bacterium]